ncbi:MAG: Ig-like domain-containing protein [Actinomycetota bacterium]
MFVTAIVVMAIINPGFKSADVRLNDSGVWVTRSDRNMVGRLNVEAQVLDGMVVAGSSSFDVLQQGDAVLVRDTGAGTVRPVDVAGLRLTESASLPKGFQIGLGSTSVGILDPDSGRLWVTSPTDIGSFSAQGTEPKVAKLAGGGVLAVGVDGSVHVATSKDASVTSVVAGESGGPGETQKSTLPGVHAADVLSITAVGAQTVVLDHTTGEALLPDGNRVKVGAAETARLQDPGPDSSAVVIATDTALITQPLNGDAATSVDLGARAEPSTPVFAAGCAYGAWAAAGRVVRQCAGMKNNLVRSIEFGTVSPQLRYRVNHGSVVLNELTGGSVWLADKSFILVKDWDDLLPDKSNVSDKPQNSTKRSHDPLKDRKLPNRPPVAVRDRFGVRPGRTTILPILNNDSDPDGDVLTAALAGPNPSIGVVQSIYGGVSQQVRVKPDAKGAATYTYQASDGRGGTATAAVSLEVHGMDVNGPPAPLRETVMVLEQGKSASVNVLNDWFDPDGDTLLLLGAKATSAGDEVRFRPDGVVTFQSAGTAAGRKEVKILVSDNIGKPVQGSLWIDVRPRGQLPPVTQPDHATTVAGRAVVVSPLVNDTDPNGDPLRLARVDDIAGAVITPDFAAGTFTFRSEKAGTYYLTYTVTDGPNSTLGLVRIDVLPNSGTPGAPVAVRDIALLPDVGNVLVDVLANDSDPSGGVLVVQSVQVPDQPGFSVALLDHQMLRITSIRALTQPVLIGYTVSNGMTSASGEVLVIQVPAPAVIQPPTAVKDEVTVRAGDVVTIPVLKNDLHPDSPVSLVRHLVESPSPADGTIFTTKDSVRFKAGVVAKTVYAVYEITDSQQQKDSAQITIHIRPMDAARNAAPRPQSITTRVLAGSTVRIAIPLDGVDPDGDSVSLLGLAKAPTKGRVVASGEGWMDFEANRDAAGSDSFTYTVQDALGARAVGSVLVGIAPAPEVNLPPVAIDDVIIVRPGREVAVAVMANDVDPEGGQVRLVTKGLEGGALKASVLLDRVVVHTPAKPGTYSVRYMIQDGFATQASAVLTVMVSESAPLLAPLARDDFLSLNDVRGRTTVDVPVLQNDEDPDGSAKNLQVSIVASTATARPGGIVRVTLTDARQILPYTVTDVDANTAMAFIRVPGLADLRPTLKPGLAPVTIKNGATLTVRLSDYVLVAAGKTARLTQAEKVQALRGTSSVVDASTMTFVSDPHYDGPAALTFEVTDGKTVDDPAGRTAVLSLPITVLPGAGANQPPVFTAPSVQVVAGQESRTDLSPYAIDPDPGDAGKLRFSVVGGAPAGITARIDGHFLVVSATVVVKTGTKASIVLEVTDGTTAAVRRSATVTVVGSSAPLATVIDDVVPDAHQGVAVTLDVLANDRSPFPNSALVLKSATVETGGSGSASVSGSRVTVTPGKAFVGVMVVRYRVADATGDPAREVDGRIRLTVQGRPAAPLTPTVVEVRNQTVVLTWAPPTNNGAVITSYTVRSAQGYTHQCAATTCTLDGLTNNVDYSFTVVATNAVGDSDPSPASSPVRPDAKPDMPQPPTLTFGDRSLTVGWTNQSYSDRSPITSVTLEISPAPPSGSAQRTALPGSSVVWAGLQNGVPYQVRVQATNRAPTPSDWSPYSASEIPAGVPGQPGQPTTSLLAPVGNQAQMSVSWVAAAPNGDAVATYALQVLRGGSVVRTIAGIPGGQTSQAVTVDTSETAYTYSVTAQNKAGVSAASVVSTARRGVVAPGPVTGIGASPQDNAIQLSFGAAAGNGASPAEMQYQYSVNGAGWNTLAGDKRVVSGVPNNGTYTVSVRTVSTVDGAQYAGPSAAAPSVEPYGRPGQPGVSASGGATSVTVNWSVPARNGRDFHVEISIDGGGWENVGASGGSRAVGNGYTQTHSIAARTVDVAGQVSGTASASAASQPRPPSSGFISPGPSGGCAGCHYIVLNYRNLPAGNYLLKFWNDSGVWWPTPGKTYKVTIGGDGQYTSVAYYGFPGTRVWVEVVGQFTTDQNFVW